MAATHLHFDCTFGISGDMTVGALVDLGVALEAIADRLRDLPIGPFHLRAEPLLRQGIRGTRVHVEVAEDEKPHRHLRHVLEILGAASLSAAARRRAELAYRRLAEAEAHVHGSTADKIHFHEVGAKDAIVDVAAAMVAVELLGAESFSAGPIYVGSGTIQCQHGVMPVPAPATAELLRALPHAAGPFTGEMVTPTGAAILRALLEDAGEPPIGGQGVESPARVVQRIGYGAGTRELPGASNYLRVLLCESPRAAAGGEEGDALPLHRHQIVVLETEIDDMAPETAGYVMERLLAREALDVQFSPVQMKKNRPGLRIRVLCEPRREAALVECLVRETSTFGVRRELTERWCLARRMETVATRLGPVAVKLGLWGERVIKASPEYEACRALAERHGVPLAEVYDLARAAAAERWGAAGGPNHDA
ncbi:MAG: hypothetical protein BWZ08_01926 [candidate division BRC1 bacterium ADurb.BinA292]|nr:MAG: hypothetical protein BWZ08_01926 [candidate division BRC1 bacterium ADurb.BinA292]